MNKTRNLAGFLFGFALLAALVIGLSTVLRWAGTAPGTESTPPPYPILEATITSDPAYPPPGETQPVEGTEMPTPIVVEAVPDPEIPIRPTVTPLLTPTPRTGPTPTPLAIGPLPLDPSGDISFAMLEGDKAISIHSLSVNEMGNLDGNPLKLSSEPIPIFGGVPIAGIIRPSPDGSRLAVINNAESGHVVSIFDTATGILNPFLPDIGSFETFYGWHPNNSQILGESKGSGLWLLDVENLGKVFLIIGSFPFDQAGILGSIQGGAVSPDGQRVVYVHQKGFSLSELWLADINGNNRVLLYSGSAIYSLRWSPDGSKLAFFGDGLMVMEVNGAPDSTPKTISRNCFSLYDFLPVWSPDGKTVACLVYEKPNSLLDSGQPITNWYTDLFEGANIHLIDVGTGEERPLIPDGITGNLDPAWSPDGSQIAFVSNRSGTNEIWVVNRDGTNLRQLTQLGTSIRYPYWHPK